MEYIYTKYPINFDQLSDEILTNLGLFVTKLFPDDILDGNITYANDNSDNNLIITLEVELTVDRETILNNIISNHVVNNGYNKLDWSRKRDTILPLFYVEAGNQLQNFANLPINRKLMACKYFIIPYVVRIQILTDLEDSKNWDFLLRETKQSRLDCVEAMRKHVGQYIRNGALTLVQTQQFYQDTRVFIQCFSDANLPDLKLWISNAVNSAYENNGFAQTTYFSSNLKNELLAIYNGNY